MKDTKEVYKKLTEWNPKKGDVFKSKRGTSVLRVVSDTTAKFDSWSNFEMTFGHFNGSYTLVSRANPIGEWIGWNGGECPVHPNTVVEVATCTGVLSVWDAEMVAWEGDDHVIAYRVIKEYKEPREYWVFTNGHGDLCVTRTWRKDAIHVKEVTEND